GSAGSGGSFDDPCRLDDGVEQHVAAGRRPFGRDLFRLVVAETVDAWAHHHRGRRHPVYPAGVMPGTGHDVAMRVAEPLRSVADRPDAALVEGDRIELTGHLDLDADRKPFADRRDAVAYAGFHRLERRLVRRAYVDGEDRPG